MSAQIQIRRDTAANWTSTNPTLAQGEMGLETDTNKLKFGDGSTAWNSLDYFAFPIPQITVLESTDLPYTIIEPAGTTKMVVQVKGNMLNDVSLIDDIFTLTMDGDPYDTVAWQMRNYTGDTTDQIPFFLQMVFDGSGNDGLVLDVVSTNGNSFENIKWVITFYH
jgi:hypothetical protein